MSEIKTPALGTEAVATIEETKSLQTFSVDLLGTTYTIDAKDPVEAYHKAEAKRAEEKQKESEAQQETNS